MYVCTVGNFLLTLAQQQQQDSIIIICLDHYIFTCDGEECKKKGNLSFWTLFDDVVRTDVRHTDVSTRTLNEKNAPSTPRTVIHPLSFRSIKKSYERTKYILMIV